MANLLHREATRVGLAGLPSLPPDDTPRDGRAEDLDWLLDEATGLESRMATASTPASDELSALQIDNADLRRRVEELECVLLESGDGDDAAWAERQREFESLIEQKSETIRDLHRQLQEVLEAVGKGGVPTAPADAGPSNEEAPALQRQIEEERHRLDEDRQQLKDDEQAMMTQMREMELSLSRDRADLARQRTELQRLQSDLNRELEQAGRDAGLRERLMSLRPAAITAANTSANTSARTSPEPEAAPKKSGLLRRMFGG